MWDQAGGFDGNTSFGSQRTEDKAAKTRCIVPLTVAHVHRLVLDESSNNFQLDNGKELDQVTLVGMLENGKDALQRYEYEFNDLTSTKPLEVRQFYDRNEETNEVSVKGYMDRTYARVFGQIRHFSGKRSMVALKIIPIENPNEITHHILQCIHYSLTLKHGASGEQTGGGNDMVVADDDGSGLNALQKKLLSIIGNCTADEGMTLTDMQKPLPNMSISTIRDNVNYLNAEGHVYSTIDEDHYRAT